MYGIMIVNPSLLQPVKRISRSSSIFCRSIEIQVYARDIYDVDSFLKDSIVSLKSGFFVERVYFRFNDGHMSDYFHLGYSDEIVTFNLYFISFEKLIEFFVLYQFDYNLISVFDKLYSVDEYRILTFYDCLLCLQSLRKHPDVLEPGSDSEQ